MSYVNIKTKEIVEPSDIMEANRNVCFPAGVWSDEMLSEFGYAELNYPETLAPGPYEYLEEGVPVEKDGKWYRSFTKKDMTEEQKSSVFEEQWHKFKIERTMMLANSDWTQLSDSPVNKEEWAIYRQTLRDLPESVDDPFKVEWPTPPEI